MLILTPDLDVGVGMLGLNPLQFLSQFFFPSFLLLGVCFLMRLSGHSQSLSHLLQIFPPLLTADGLPD